MKLSIIIPTYNSSRVLRRALDSILYQTFTDYEVLIMDGASSDDTVMVAESYNNSKIKVYSEPDKGIYDAMNKGILKSSGEWLYFLGSDDWLYDDNVLKKVFCKKNINDYDVIYGNFESSHLSPKHNGEWKISEIEYNRCHQAIFYRKSFISKVGGYHLKYPVLADFYLNLKWLLDNRFTHMYIDITIAHFSEGGTSGNIIDNRFNKDIEKIILFNGWNKLSHEQRKYYLHKLLQKSKLGNYCLKIYNSVKHYIQ